VSVGVMPTGQNDDRGGRLRQSGEPCGGELYGVGSRAFGVEHVAEMEDNIRLQTVHRIGIGVQDFINTVILKPQANVSVRYERGACHSSTGTNSELGIHCQWLRNGTQIKKYGLADGFPSNWDTA